MALTLNTSHPLHSNILSFVCVSEDGSSLVDLKSPARTFTPTTSGSFVYGSGALGRHIKAPAANGSYIGASPDIVSPNYYANTTFTAIVVINNTSNISSGGSNQPAYFNFERIPTLKSDGLLGISPSAGLAQTFTSSTNVLGQGQYSMAFVHKGYNVGNECALFHNGVRLGSTTYLDDSGALRAVNRLGSHQGYTYHESQYVYWIFFNKALTETEILDIHNSLGADNQISLLSSGGGTTTPITFTGTIPNQTFTNGQSVSVDLTSYFSGTQTPFSFANTGTALTGTGLNVSSAGILNGTATTGSVTGAIVTGTDADLDTASSNAFNVTVNAAGSPPAGAFTVGTITTTQTTATVPYTYSAADFDSIEYRIDGGAAVTASASPQALTGLTSATTYGIEFRAVNTFGNGAWSTSAAFTTSGAAVSFVGGTIPAISGTQNSAITPVDTSTYFTGSLTPFTYSLFSGTLPSGVTLNSSTGVISGTPTVSFTGNIVVRATDSGSNTANSNSIAINIAAASADGILTSKKFSNNTGQLLANLTGLTVYVYNKTTGALIVTKTSETTDANGICVVSDALIVSGTQYVVVYTNGTDYGIEVLTAT